MGCTVQPTDPQVVYVPTYDPNTAYGQWSNPSYPPTYYPTGGALLTGLAWGVGIAAAGADGRSTLAEHARRPGNAAGAVTVALSERAQDLRR
jgi:Protein of unknown function (DUF3300)